MNSVAQAVSQSLDLEEVLNGALEEVRVVLNVKVGWILLKGDGGRLELAAAKGFSEASPPEVIENIPETCACRQTLAGGQARFVDGSPVCLRGGLEALQREGLDRHVSVPLKAKEKVLGIMNLAYPADRHFAEDDIQVLNSIGQQIGMAIENAQLYVERADFQEHLLTTAEEIRRGIAQDLHDDVGQELTGLGLKAETLAEMLAPAETPAGKLAADVAAAVDRTREQGPRALSGTVAGRTRGGPAGGRAGAACRMRPPRVRASRASSTAPTPIRSSTAASPCTCIVSPRRPSPTPCGIAGRGTSASLWIRKTARPP